MCHFQIHSMQIHLMQELTGGDGDYDNDAYDPLLAERSELETRGNMAYGVLDDIPSKPNPSYEEYELYEN